MSGKEHEDYAANLMVPDLRKRTSLRVQVAEALRGAVITGVMRPGAVYTAPALAERFGVSATPVREAMLDLVKDGLVRAVRNKGFRVTELSDAELDQMAEVRMLVEVPTVESIARTNSGITKVAIARLRRLAREIVANAKRGDLIGYIDADRKFHSNLLSLSGNAQIVSVIDDLRCRSRLYGLEQLVEQGKLERSAAEHEQLLDLVLDGDSVKAGELMRRHIGHVRGAWAGRPDQAAIDG